MKKAVDRLADVSRRLRRLVSDLADGSPTSRDITYLRREYLAAFELLANEQNEMRCALDEVQTLAGIVKTLTAGKTANPSANAARLAVASVETAAKKARAGVLQTRKDLTTAATPFPVKAKKYLNRAIRARMVEETATGYIWLFGRHGSNTGVARLAYFIRKVYGPARVPVKDIERLFNIDGLGDALARLSWWKSRLWEEEIDALFRDGWRL